MYAFLVQIVKIDNHICFFTLYMALLWLFPPALTVPQWYCYYGRPYRHCTPIRLLWARGALFC